MVTLKSPLSMNTFLLNVVIWIFPKHFYQTIQTVSTFMSKKSNILSLLNALFEEISQRLTKNWYMIFNQYIKAKCFKKTH